MVPKHKAGNWSPARNSHIGVPGIDSPNRPQLRCHPRKWPWRRLRLIGMPTGSVSLASDSFYRRAVMRYLLFYPHTFPTPVNIINFFNYEISSHILERNLFRSLIISSVWPTPVDKLSSRDTISCAIARACQSANQASFPHSCVIYRLHNEMAFSTPLSRITAAMAKPNPTKNVPKPIHLTIRGKESGNGSKGHIFKQISWKRFQNCVSEAMSCC